MNARTAGLVVAAPLALVASLALGAVAIPPGTLLGALTGAGGAEATIIRTLRLPRALLAFGVGGGLAVAGAALQALVRNPIAEPYLLGLSGGAGLGAVVAIAAGFAHPWGLPLAATLGALAAVVLVYRISVVAGQRLDPRVLLLAGVVVGLFAGAVTTAIITVADPATTRSALFWLLGGFGAASWTTLGVYGGYALPALLLLARDARQLDLLALGEEPAQHLGADVERVKRVIYVAVAVLAAASVAVAGVVGFVGLVVPHTVRRLWSPLHRELLPVAFLLGGTFLVLADAVARTVARPIELPVGVITALVGVPLFALLLRRTVA